MDIMLTPTFTNLVAHGDRHSLTGDRSRVDNMFWFAMARSSVRMPQ
jgi:hypothetical protein